MRVCILYAGLKANDESISKIVKGMSDGISSMGHTVEALDMYLEAGKRISFFDYVVVISRTNKTWGASIPEQVSTFLKTAGTISGKRCSCFISKHGMRKLRTLQVLMRKMESEGMYLKNSDIISNESYAYAVGKRLHIEKN